jgi:effector-binding domain-containing protein
VNKFAGPEQGVGASRSWKGEEAGVGSITVIESRPYEYIRNELVFGPGEGVGMGSWNFEENDEGTNVTWTIHATELSYPNYRWMGLLAEMVMKPMMVQGLNNLKKLTEPMPDPPEIKVVDLTAQPSFVIPDSSTIDSMGAMFQRNYKKLFDFINWMKYPITGQRFAIYHNWNPDGYTRVSAGVPVQEDSKGFKEIKYYELPATLAIFAQHKGGYTSASTHYAIDEYIKDFNLEVKDYIWETYLYDPINDPDSTQWVTWIYYPLK